MKSIKSKILGITLAVLLISTGTYVFSANYLNNKNQTNDENFEALNFKSYSEMNLYLQTSLSSKRNNDDESSVSLGSQFSQDSENSLDELSIANNVNEDITVDLCSIGIINPDLVKTYDDDIYVVTNSTLYIISGSQSNELKVISQLSLNASQVPKDLFIENNKIAVITQSFGNSICLLNEKEENVKENEGLIKTSPPPSVDMPINKVSTHVLLYDINGENIPEKIKDIEINGFYSSAELVNDWVYIITSETNYELKSKVSEKEYIPYIKINENVENIDLSNIYYIDDSETSKTISYIVSVNLENNEEPINAYVYILKDSRSFSLSTNNLYITQNNINYDYSKIFGLIEEYLFPLLDTTAIRDCKAANSLNLDDYQKIMILEWIIEDHIQNVNEKQRQQIAQQVASQIERTIIHKINLNEGSIVYASQISLPGSIRSPSYMNEYNGTLRVITTMYGGILRQFTPTVRVVSNLYILDESMEKMGELTDIGEGRDIQFIQFLNNSLYLTTSEISLNNKIIDLKDPYNLNVILNENPSEYNRLLLPYNENHAIRIEKDNETVNINLLEHKNNGGKTVVYPSKTFQMQKNNMNSFWQYTYNLFNNNFKIYDKNNYLIIPLPINSVNSVLVFNMDNDNFDFQGIINHTSSDYNSQIDKSESYLRIDNIFSINDAFIIDNAVYTISGAKIQMNDLETLDEINSLDFI